MKLFSLVISDSPHAAITFEGKDRRLTKLQRSELIDIEKKISDVEEFLMDPMQSIYYASSIIGSQCPLATKNTRKDCKMHAIKDGEIVEINDESTCIFICFDGAKEITNLFLRKKLKWPTVKKERFVIWEDISIHSISYLRGVYLCAITHKIESHSFVLGITEKDIVVFNTYGGEQAFYVKRFDREKWCRNFVYFFTDASPEYQESHYHKAWGMPYEVTNKIVGYKFENSDKLPLRIESMEIAKIL